MNHNLNGYIDPYQLQEHSELPEDKVHVQLAFGLNPYYTDLEEE